MGLVRAALLIHVGGIRLRLRVARLVGQELAVVGQHIKRVARGAERAKAVLHAVLVELAARGGHGYIPLRRKRRRGNQQHQTQKQAQNLLHFLHSLDDYSPLSSGSSACV